MDDVVYHYTDAAGVLGMARSGSIWCTHLAYLNDTREYRYLADAFGELLMAMAREHHTLTKMQRRFALVNHQRLEESYDDAREGTLPTHLNQGPKYFAASFSECPDDLAQWRAYGGSRLKFAVGFSARALGGYLQSYGFRFGKVTYGFDAIREEFRQKFLQHANELEKRFIAPAGRYDDPLSIHVPEFTNFNAGLIDPLAPLRKHPAFSAESEWRLYGCFLSEIRDATRLDIDLREGRSFLIPFMPVPLCAKGEQTPVVSLTIGPTAHPVEAKVAAEHLSKYQLFRNIPGKIVLSKIPYRDW